MKELQITTSKSKRISYVAIFALVSIVYFAMTSYKLLTYQLGMTLTCITGALALYFLYTVYFPRKYMEVNNEGIHRKAFKGPKFIAWSEISEIYICIDERKNMEYFSLGINLHKDKNDKRKVKFKGKTKGEKGEIIIDIDELSMKPYDIYNNLQKYYNKNVK